jgi:hypothetical protein
MVRQKWGGRVACVDFQMKSWELPKRWRRLGVQHLAGIRAERSTLRHRRHKKDLNGQFSGSCVSLSRQGRLLVDQSLLLNRLPVIPQSLSNRSPGWASGEQQDDNDCSGSGTLP